MGKAPSSCPSCGKQNIHNLDYCAVCGNMFEPEIAASPNIPLDRKRISKEDKLRAKRTKKRKELTALYRKGKITTEQYAAGLKKLGYSTDIEKAEAFKKYIREQIKVFEEMKVDQTGKEGGYYYDPNESRTDLPRDEFGNVIFDFSLSREEKKEMKRPTEEVPYIDHGRTIREQGHGPVFGQGIFGERGARKVRERPESGERPRIYREPAEAPAKRKLRRIKALADWDEDEDEGLNETGTGDGIGNEGESGWWDDSEWVLEWTEEDEEEFDDWDMELEDEEEDDDEGWVLEFEEEEDDEEFEIIFEEENEVPTKRVEQEFEGSYVISFEEEEEDKDKAVWETPSRKGKRRKHR